MRLTVCNGAGCTTVERMVEVLDPLPVVTSADAGVNLSGFLAGAPIVARVGDLLRLAGTGKGKPQLAYSWEVVQATAVVSTLTGADVWLNTVGLAPGPYELRMLITNPAGHVRSIPTPLSLLASAELAYFTVTPCRVYDSRVEGSPLVHGSSGLVLQVAGRCGIPTSARSMVGNVTVVSPSGTGLLSARPGNYPPLVPTNVAFDAGQTRAAFATLPLASDGTGSVAFSASVAGGGTVHFILDVNGYFAPPF